MIKPIYIVALVSLVFLVALMKISNPHKHFSRSQFWESATIDSVSEIPDEVLKPGNKNGPVLMWAAIGSNDPAIIKALVNRGAEINESDIKFQGTALTGAASFTHNPEIINMLIELGADIHKTVNNDETALMVAARYNENENIISTLLKHGAKLDQVSKSGETAIIFAEEHNNLTAIKELKQASE